MGETTQGRTKKLVKRPGCETTRGEGKVGEKAQGRTGKWPKPPGFRYHHKNGWLHFRQAFIVMSYILQFIILYTKHSFIKRSDKYNVYSSDKSETHHKWQDKLIVWNRDPLEIQRPKFEKKKKTKKKKEKNKKKTTKKKTGYSGHSYRLAPGWAKLCSQIKLLNPHLSPKGPENGKLTTLYRCMEDSFMDSTRHNGSCCGLLIVWTRMHRSFGLKQIKVCFFQELIALKVNNHPMKSNKHTKNKYLSRSKRTCYSIERSG